MCEREGEGRDAKAAELEAMQAGLAALTADMQVWGEFGKRTAQLMSPYMCHHAYRCVLPPSPVHTDRPAPPLVLQRADVIQHQMQEAADEQQGAYEATIRKLRGQLQGLQAAVGAAAESGSLAALAGMNAGSVDGV